MLIETLNENAGAHRLGSRPGAVGAARARACSSRSLAAELPQLLPPACRRRRRRWVGTRAAAAAVSSTAATLSAAAAPSASSKLQLLREASLERRAAATEFLADRFSAQFCDTLRRPLRAVGREAEYPVVWADGSAADVRLLLASRYLPALPVLAPPCMRRASSAFLIASKSAFLALLFPPAKGFVCNLPIVANVTALF